MGLNKQFGELIGEDVPCDGEEDLGFAPTSGSLKERMIRNYSAQQVVRMPFVFDIAKGRMVGEILTLVEFPDRISGPVIHAVLMGKGLANA